MSEKLLSCFWKRPDQLTLNVEQAKVMENDSEIESVQNAIEVSHGSVDFSKSSSNQMYIKGKICRISIYVTLLVFAIAIGILLPLFWFGLVPTNIISVYLKKLSKYRLPVTITVEIIVVAFAIIIIIGIYLSSRSVRKRRSYLTSCSTGNFSAIAAQNTIHNSLPSTPQPEGSFRRNTGSLLKQPKQQPQPMSGMHIFGLRTILEELSTDSVERIQQLSIKFLNSGKGQSLIVAGKPVIPASSQSNTGNNFRIATKVLLIGDINVGKTSIFHRILYDQFSESYLPTIGADVGLSTLYLSSSDKEDQLSVGLQMWDISGQKQLSNEIKIYSKDAVIIMPVVDITNLSSLSALQFWLAEVLSKVYDPYLVLLLNKADLNNRKITPEDINNIKELKNVERYEVSAKTGVNVVKAFTNIIAKYLIKETAKLL